MPCTSGSRWTSRRTSPSRWASQWSSEWDHNAHYHELLLRRLPRPIDRALDVGCGLGLFASRLAAIARRVDAVDLDAETLRAARAGVDRPNLRFLACDFLGAELPAEHYDAITCIAAVHHMDLSAALEKMQSLLAPGGTVAILGLYREASPTDFAYSAAAAPCNLVLRIARLRRSHGPAIEPPKRPATMGLGEIRAVARSVMPGAALRRHLFWRYSLVWTRPH